MGYNDVMMMPTYERRYFINLMIKQNEKRIEAMESQQIKNSSNSKGNRQSKISGEALKTKIKSGEIPLT